MVHQRDSSERKKRMTFIVLPHNSMREVFRLNVPNWVAGILGAVLLAIALTVLIFFVYSTTITSQLIHYWALKVENKIQEQQIKSFYDKTQKLESGIRELEERDQELREMLGLQKPKKVIKLNDIRSVTELKERMASLDNFIDYKKSEYKFLTESSLAMIYKFNNFPSMSPVTSPLIYSKFGWRIHPFSGMSEFHRGVDIPIWIGFPVRSAADGFVEYSAWAKGYGYAVIVNHENGYKTLYGHNSRLLVKKGDRIFKGQVLAKAGNTGLSTGPHVHYEVKIVEKYVNPEKYLNLNVFSARYNL